MLFLQVTLKMEKHEKTTNPVLNSDITQYLGTASVSVGAKNANQATIHIQGEAGMNKIKNRKNHLTPQAWRNTPRRLRKY